MPYREYKIRASERVPAGLVYLAALLPLWGILIAWAIREGHRERSRHVMANATQAIWLQVALLVAAVVFFAARLLFALIEILSPPISRVLWIVNDSVFGALVAAFAIAMLVAAWLALDGRRVIFPLIGRRVYAQEYEDLTLTMKARSAVEEKKQEGRHDESDLRG